MKIRNLRKAGLYADGQSLYLRVRDSGTKSWIFRYLFAGRRRDMGLGVWPAIPLAEARVLVREAHASISRGIDPIDARRDRVAGTRAQAKVVTFAQAADRYIAAHESSWRNAKHREQWRATLNDYAGPVLGGMNVAAIETGHILEVLEPVWADIPETASRLRGRIEAVLDWAKARGLRSGENPARWRGHLENLLAARSKARGVKHHAALNWREMPQFMADLRGVQSITARALEFTILTAARTGEAIGATWAEIDQREAVWTIAAERMKTGQAHRVPLTAAAFAVFEGVPRFRDNLFLFPGTRRGQGLSNTSMLKLLQELRPCVTVHGFRSTFRDWAAEQTSFPREIAEMALAHKVGTAVEAAYRRSDLIEKRRKLMQTWASFCGRGVKAGDVVALRGRG